MFRYGQSIIDRSTDRKLRDRSLSAMPISLSPMPTRDDSPQMRSKRGRIGAYESWARTEDRTARTWHARKAALDRVEREADADGVLTAQEHASGLSGHGRHIFSGWR